ncbi:MAG: hypothetical protein OEY49_02950 [Candidatus Heimdallarchaeota archaeon]|nr:hypothetical protein [Candidatus Heimdallarchaeota archaeon]
MTNQIVMYTEAYMSKLDSSKPIEISKEFVSKLDLSHKNLLIIYSGNSRLIRTISVKSDYTIKIIIVIEKLLPDFVGSLGSLITNLKITPIYSSAICYYETYCTYEAYFEPNVLTDIKFDEFKVRVLDIKGVIDVISRNIVPT